MKSQGRHALTRWDAAISNLRVIVGDVLVGQGLRFSLSDSWGLCLKVPIEMSGEAMSR